MIEFVSEAKICYGWCFKVDANLLSFQKLVKLFNLTINYTFHMETKYGIEYTNNKYVDYDEYLNIQRHLIKLFDLFQKENKTQAIVKGVEIGGRYILIYYPVYSFQDNYSIFEPDFHMFTTFLKRVKERADKDEIFEEIEKTTMIKPSCFIIQEEE